MSTQPFSPSLYHLLWFSRIVEAGSFAEAARRAGVTTSAVSKALSRFEQQHSVRLLHRSTHGLALTEEGELMLSLARGLAKEVEHVENTLRGFDRAGSAGRVRISVPSSFGRVCIVPALPPFLASYPDISLELHFSDAMMDLSSGGYDFVIRSGELNAWPGHSARRLFSFRWGTYASSDYLAKKGTPETPSDLKMHSLIGYWNQAKSRTEPWSFLSPEEGRLIKFEPDTRYLFDDGQIAWSMLRAGLGIGWAPEWLGIDDLTSGTVKEVLQHWRIPQTDMWLLRLERRLTPKRTQIVMDFIIELLSEYHRGR